MQYVYCTHYANSLPKMRYFHSKLDCIHWPSLSLHTVSRAVWMNSSLVLVYTAGLIVIVFLSCWPLSVNVCFIWLDAEIAFLCFETAVNLLKTKLFLWQSDFSFLCVWCVLNAPLWPSVQSEGEAVAHTLVSQGNIVFGDTCRCGGVVSVYILKGPASVCHTEDFWDCCLFV